MPFLLADSGSARKGFGPPKNKSKWRKVQENRKTQARKTARATGAKRERKTRRYPRLTSRRAPRFPLRRPQKLHANAPPAPPRKKPDRARPPLPERKLPRPKRPPPTPAALRAAILSPQREQSPTRPFACALISSPRKERSAGKQEILRAIGWKRAGNSSPKPPDRAKAVARLTSASPQEAEELTTACAA